MFKPEDVLEKVLSGELTRQEAIDHWPEMHDRLMMLTDLTDELRALPEQRPDPEFRNRARLHLLQRIQETERRRAPWQRILDPLAGLSGWGTGVSALGVAGGVLATAVGFASVNALPDDRLYPVKRAVENVRLALALSDEAKAGVYLDVADRRAAEIAAVASDVDDRQLHSLTFDYGTTLQQMNLVVQKLPSPPLPLLDKMQSHLASQATELEARAVNSSSRPAVQQSLTDAEMVASNVVDHVTFVAEQRGSPGVQDVRLANNAPAAATASAQTIQQLATATPAPAVGVSPNASPSVAPSQPKAAATPPATPASVAPAASNPPAASAWDGQFDRLWNDVAGAPYMGQKVRLQLEQHVVDAKQNARAGRFDSAIADLNAFEAQLQQAVKTYQATQYTASHLTAEANGSIAALKAGSPSAH